MGIYNVYKHQGAETAQYGLEIILQSIIPKLRFWKEYYYIIFNDYLWKFTYSLNSAYNPSDETYLNEKNWVRVIVEQSRNMKYFYVKTVERGAGTKKAHWRVEIVTIFLPKLAISTNSRENGRSVSISNAICYVIDPFRSRNWGFYYLNLPLRHCWWMRGRARLHNEHETRTWEKQGWRQVRGNFFS